MVCRVCLKYSESELQMFGENGVEQQIPQILQLHLWFTPSPDDPLSKAICLPCWVKILDFHQFYEAAKEAHKFYENQVLEPITIKTESSETNKFEECLDNGQIHELYQDHHEILVNAQNIKTLRYPVEIVKHEDANNETWIDEREDIYTQRNKIDNSEIISPLYESEFITIKNESPEAKGIRKRVADNFQNDSADDVDDGGSSDEDRDFDVNTDSQSGNETENTTKTTENTTKTANNKRKQEKRYDRYLKDEENLKCPKKKSKIISCKLCGIFVEGRFALTSHKQNAHAVEQFNCNLCSKTFARKVSLKEHMAKHLGEWLYKCPFCDRSFNSSANMYSHRKKVHPVEYEKWCWKRKTNQLNRNLNLNCNLCSKTFKQQISLKEHMAKHSGERLYKCSFCPRTSNSSSNMYAHRKKEHPVEYEIWRKTKLKLCLQTSSSPTQ